MSGPVFEEEVVKSPLVKPKKQLQRPRQYKVFLLNDDYTPMEFVVDILQRFFQLDETMAAQVMLQVHEQGKAVCGIFTRDIAETKVHQVSDYAEYKEYPLFCGMEPA